MPKSTTNRLLELDTLRGIAAMGVVLFHLTMRTKHRSLVFDFGLTGVDLFFMISGFVILMSLHKVKSLKEFIMGRFLRLYPMYWVAVVLSVISLITVSAIPFNLLLAKRFLGNLTMFQPLLAIPHMDGVYWTLFVELEFYILMALTYQLLSLDKVEKLLLLGIVLSVITGLLIRPVIGVWGQRLHRVLPILEYLPLFLSGIIYYNLRYIGKTRLRYLLLLICYVSQVLLFHLEVNRIMWITPYQYMLPLVVYHIVFLLFTFNKLKFLVNPITVFLGTISYPIYLIHQTVARLLSFFHNFWGYWTAVFVEIAAIILLSYLIWRFIEKPLISYFKRKLTSEKFNTALQSS